MMDDMVTKIYTHPTKTDTLYPLMTAEERLRLLRGIRGMWKNRKPDPIRKLKKIRKGWERVLPSIR